MERLHCAEALLPEGIVRDVAITITPAPPSPMVDVGGTSAGFGGRAGDIAAVEIGVALRPGDTRLPGLTLPGLPNLHSHTFQRGMAGLSERRGTGPDSFWTWREVMYRFLDRLNPDDVEAIAAQSFVEMLEGGFSAVAEFHYLHHQPDGRPYASIARMGEAIIAAANDTGIGLTLLPVLYRTGNFGGAAPSPGQRRFLNDRDAYARLIEETWKAMNLSPETDGLVSVAPHSLRAVPLDDLAWVRRLSFNGLVHIHVAEQMREVEDCLAATGRRPVELLMDTVALDQGWSLIHATHLTAAERDAIAKSGAIAGLCPLTEASLGDGIFDGIAFRGAGGRFGVGSDSNIQIGAGPELRQLEYSQRLRDRGRALWADAGASTGETLWREACAGGARACAREIGEIAVGRRADFVTLDAYHIALFGRGGAEALDSAIFAANTLPIAEVRVGGRLLVEAGRHVGRDRIATRFAAVMKKLAA